VLVPLGASEDGATFETEWATSDSGQANAGRAPSQTVNQTGVDA
jgi:hypothetical protein